VKTRDVASYVFASLDTYYSLKNALIQNQLQRTLVITIKNEVIHASKIILVLIIDTQANYLIPDYSFPDYLIT